MLYRASVGFAARCCWCRRLPRGRPGRSGLSLGALSVALLRSLLRDSQLVAYLLPCGAMLLGVLGVPLDVVLPRFDLLREVVYLAFCLVDKR